MHITLEAEIERETRIKQKIDTLSYFASEAFDEMAAIYISRRESHHFELIGASKHGLSYRYSLTFSWYSNETLASVLQLAAVLHRRFHAKMAMSWFSAHNGDINNTKTVISNFESPRDICPKGEIAELKDVELISFEYLSMFVVKNLSCFLDFERVGFTTFVEDNTDEKNPPRTISRVIVCKKSQIESACGLIPNEYSLHECDNDSQPPLVSAPAIHPKPKPSLQNADDSKSDEESAVSDSKIFKRICYSFTAFNQIIVCVFCLIMAIKGPNSHTYLFHMLLGVAFTLMMLLYLIAPDVKSNGKITMGALSHLAWLLFSSMAITILLHHMFGERKRNRYNDDVNNDIATEEFTSSREANYALSAMKILLLINVLVVVFCIVNDIEKSDDIQIDYSHRDDRLLWISNQTACLAVLICPFAVVLSILFVLRTVPCIGRTKNKEIDVPDQPFVQKVVGAAKSGACCDLFYLALVTVGILDYFDDDHHHLWSLVFSVISVLFGLWHTAIVLNSPDSLNQAKLKHEDV